MMEELLALMRNQQPGMGSVPGMGGPGMGAPPMAAPGAVPGAGLPFPRPGMMGAAPGGGLNLQALLGAMGGGGQGAPMGGVGMGRLPIPPRPNKSPVHEIVRNHFASRPLMGGRRTSISGAPPSNGAPLSRPSATSGY